MARKLVCVCNFITEKEILSSIAEGATTMEDIKLFTGAGTSCGKCHPAIKELLAESQKTRQKDPQTRLF